MATFLRLIMKVVLMAANDDSRNFTGELNVADALTML